MKSIEYGQRNKAVIIHVIIKHSFTNYYFAARCYDDGDQYFGMSGFEAIDEGQSYAQFDREI